VTIAIYFNLVSNYNFQKKNALLKVLALLI